MKKNDIYRYCDKGNLKEIEEIINSLISIKRNNPDFMFDEHFVYLFISQYDVKETDKVDAVSGKSCREFFSYWESKFKYSNHVRAFVPENRKYFFVFSKGHLTKGDDLIKLYIPLSYDNIKDSVTDIISYIEQLDVDHESKVSSNIRSDDFVVRVPFSAAESAFAIIDYIKNNPKLKSSIEKLNPFVPSYEGIGIMNENGSSYNSQIASVITSYIYHLETQNNDFSWTLDDFYNYAYNKLKTRSFKDCLNVIYDKPIEYVNHEKFDKYEKMTLIYGAVLETIKKYGLAQGKAALKHAVCDNDFRYFTRGEKGHNNRDVLKIAFTPPERVMDTLVDVFNYSNSTEDEIVDIFFNNVVSINPLIMFQKICDVTYNKYGIEHLFCALKSYLTDGTVNRFSRYEFDNINDNQKNYRNALKELDYVYIRKILYDTLSREGFFLSDDSPESISQAYIKKIQSSSHRLSNS